MSADEKELGVPSGRDARSDEYSKALEDARRIIALADRLTTPQRPTIAELEALLQQPDGLPVHINPDGSIGAGTNDALTVARAFVLSANAHHAMKEALRRVDHTLSLHGKVDADTDLHRFVQDALKLTEI